MRHYTYLVLLQAYCTYACQVPLRSCGRKLKGFLNLLMSNSTNTSILSCFLLTLPPNSYVLITDISYISKQKKRFHISYTQWYINPSTKCNQYVVSNWSHFLILKPLCTSLSCNIYDENSRTSHTILSISYLKQFHGDTATVAVWKSNFNIM